jgi:SAM-dependent methyltransferase
MKEEEIRPAAIFEEYLALAREDIATYFSAAPRHDVSCPACGSRDCRPAFAKDGFSYCECPACGTLFVTPRPDESAFSRFYEDSKSVRFWATSFYKETERSRQELIIRPKAALAAAIIRKYLPAEAGRAPVIADIGAGYGGFCTALREVLPAPYEIVGIEPALALQEVCRQKGIAVVPKFLEEVSPEDIPGHRLAAATSFELLEHLYDPGRFIRHCHGLLQDGGLLILTTLNGQGFDLRMLGDASKSISPPHHINFFNPASVTILLEREGFEVLEITTPGKLDVDIVAKQLADVKCDFMRDFIRGSDAAVREKFQELIRETKTSSHMMIVARKK